MVQTIIVSKGVCYCRRYPSLANCFRSHLAMRHFLFTLSIVMMSVPHHRESAACHFRFCCLFASLSSDSYCSYCFYRSHRFSLLFDEQTDSSQQKPILPCSVDPFIVFARSVCRLSSRTGNSIPISEARLSAIDDHSFLQHFFCSSQYVFLFIYFLYPVVRDDAICVDCCVF